MSKLQLSIAMGDYDRNRALYDGAVQIDGYTSAGKREGSVPRRRLLDEAI